MKPLLLRQVLRLNQKISFFGVERWAVEACKLFDEECVFVIGILIVLKLTNKEYRVADKYLLQLYLCSI